MRTFLSAFIVAAVIGSGCASAPPNLSPAASVAFQNTRVIKGLDLLRDTVIAAEAQTPPLLSRNTARAIVTYHASALRIIDATGAGWQVVVLTSLDEVVRGLPPNESRIVAPYVALAKVLIGEVR